jgi:hypothetical protein
MYHRLRRFPLLAISGLGGGNTLMLWLMTADAKRPSTKEKSICLLEPAS